MFSFAKNLVSSVTGGGEAIVDHPELKTVKNGEECVALLDEIFQNALKYANAADWQSFYFEDPGLTELGLNDVDLSDKAVSDDHPVKSLRASGTLPIAPKKLWEILWENKLETVKQWDADLISYEKILIINENAELTRARVTAPYPVYPREFVTVRGRKEVDGVFYIFSTSVNTTLVEPDSTYVRGVIETNFFMLKPVDGQPDRVHLTRVTQVDPKGNIPTFVTEMVKKKSGEYVVKLRRVMYDTQK
eukprot:TRINITY_DN27121_c0_g1_i1.p1 TRINITY_DN27121_c0_g1~~TRINITY_DN27121_c0_g1_i1.p1  ORF type:complete len:256 (-),score=70.69 TRINITY_DN27121_c0_g1_i1:103-843(-)